MFTTSALSVFLLACGDSTSGADQSPPNQAPTEQIPAEQMPTEQTVCSLTGAEACTTEDLDAIFRCNEDGTIRQSSCMAEEGFGAFCNAEALEPSCLAAPDPCARACSGLTLCGLCISIEGQCLSLSDCVTSCQTNAQGDTVATCLNSLRECNQTAVNGCLAAFQTN